MASPFPEGCVSCRAGACQLEATLPICGCSLLPPPSQQAAPSWWTPNSTMQELAVAPSQGPIRSVQPGCIQLSPRSTEMQGPTASSDGARLDACSRAAILCVWMSPNMAATFLQELTRLVQPAACSPFSPGLQGPAATSDWSPPGARSVASRPCNVEAAR